MQSLTAETKLFAQHKNLNTQRSRQRAALFLLAGIDLEDIAVKSQPEKERLLLRIDRLIERERLRGQRRHWNYNLNRHISLKQLRDQIQSNDDFRSFQ